MKHKAKFAVVLLALVALSGTPLAQTNAWLTTSSTPDAGTVTAGTMNAAMTVAFGKLGIPGETITSGEIITMHNNNGAREVYCQVSFAKTDATDTNLIKEMAFVAEGGAAIALKEIEGRYYAKLPGNTANTNIGYLEITFKGEEIDAGRDGNEFRGKPFHVATTFKICQVNDDAALEYFGIGGLADKLATPQP